MASASPTDGRSAREPQDRSGEAFEPFDGGMNTLADPTWTCWRRSREGRRRDGRSGDRGDRGP